MRRGTGLKPTKNYSTLKSLERAKGVKKQYITTLTAQINAILLNSKVRKS